MFCVGKNYFEHAAEFSSSGYDSSTSADDVVPKHPIVFTKAWNTLIAHGDEIPRHAGVTEQLDYEAEFAVIIGKGGLGDESLKAFGDLGGVYLAIIGGTAALETTWIETIEDVDMDDLNPESLWKFRIRDFGPLRVAMDSHGGSLYETVRRDAAGRRAAALASMGVRG
ncbi:MAG: fumarate hydratase C-terminal domain-containing protein [Proteobacteria bacterium]|nr:fumarate hydratase C-terminal domain-containing protein [Pseudomonadota bacterium]